MAKIFAKQSDINNHPSRNNFDLSHKIHMSGKMGVLYPVFCKPVVPGDTFRIDSGCAINFMPMPYPTQTRMRFIQHFFYVRNKNIWKNWDNWLQGLPDNDTGQSIVPPYIDKPASFYKTGGLADFLGIPTVSIERGTMDVHDAMGMSPVEGSVEYRASSTRYSISFGNDLVERLDGRDYILGLNGCYNVVYTSKQYSQGLIDTTVEVEFAAFDVGWNDTFLKSMSLGVFVKRNGYGDLKLVGSYCYTSLSMFNQQGSGGSTYFGSYDSSFYLSNEEIADINDKVSEAEYWCFGVIFETTAPQETSSGQYYQLDLATRVPFFVKYAVTRTTQVELTDVNMPYYYRGVTSPDDLVKVSALPFRAYESIYNCFYRNQNGNQPFIINGRTQYNKYITNNGDGADKTDYQLMYRNWELDAYTSCLPSPQQGPAPVVGITSLGRVTIVDPETGVTSTAQAHDNGNGMTFTDVNIAEDSHQKYLVNLASSGITINDFRNVNALQRFLETSIRKGFRYVDFIEGHFGHRIKDAVMDMPEFIGGFSQNVDVSKINNMTEGLEDSVLGDYAGQASAFGGTSHTIQHFCDDFGFIVGILCLVPDATYSQILPKHFNVKQPLDYYFPEFSQIGLQPITYEEIAPIQSHGQFLNDGVSKLTDVFGYQRPNHDLVWYPDTLHGEFRKTFSDYIVNRRFIGRPELGNDFLVIKPQETNSIFNYTAPDADVFVGQVAFDVKAKRPVPRVVIPGLGR